MKIRKGKKSDVNTLISIGKKIKEFQVDPKIQGFWSKRQLERWIKSKFDTILIAEENKKIIGFAMFAHHVPTGKVTFENAWVDSKMRRKGISSMLLNEGLKQLKKKGATYLCGLTKEDATSSIKFQEKNKFQKGYKFWWFHKKM